MNTQLIEADGGEQIVLLPAGFAFSAEDVQIEKDGDRVIISPIRQAAPTDLGT